MLHTAVGIALLLVVLVVILGRLLAVTRAATRAAQQETDALRRRFRRIVDVDEEAKRIWNDAALRASMAADEAAERIRARDAAANDLTGLAERVASLRAELDALDEQANLQSFGFYKAHYDFDTSEAYRREEEIVRAQQAALIKAERAAVCDTEWHVGGSRTEGLKMIGQTLRLMLRAFNGECDAAVARVKYNNVHVMEARIQKAFDTINKAASVQRCRITVEYLHLKFNELRLTHEYQEKYQQEKEEQRRIKEQMREEEIARREIEKAQSDAEKEERRYQEALLKARDEVTLAEGAKRAKLEAQIAEMEARLREAHERKERAIARAQLTRSGHVYVISNIGSFGENIFKIGMTRRLEPMDRIKELGDASVPFQFDVHAIIFTEDAPRLENELHRRFSDRRVNRVNERKEFFHVSIEEIAAAVRENHGEIELTRLAEAEEFRKTLALLQQTLPADLPRHWFAVDALFEGGDTSRLAVAGG